MIEEPSWQPPLRDRILHFIYENKGVTKVQITLATGKCDERTVRRLIKLLISEELIYAKQRKGYRSLEYHGKV
jgi:predicted transcriptional regulator